MFFKAPIANPMYSQAALLPTPAAVVSTCFFEDEAVDVDTRSGRLRL
jgi:hypothetical protein